MILWRGSNGLVLVLQHKKKRWFKSLSPASSVLLEMVPTPFTWVEVGHTFTFRCLENGNYMSWDEACKNGLHKMLMDGSEW